MSINNVDRLKRFCKEKFRSATLLVSGFSINMITVEYKPHYISVTVFEKESGKAREAFFDFPENAEDLVKYLISHCGNNIVRNQLKFS